MEKREIKRKIKMMDSLQITNELSKENGSFIELLEDIKRELMSKRKIERFIYGLSVSFYFKHLWRLRRFKKETDGKKILTPGRYQFSFGIKSNRGSIEEFIGADVWIDKPIKQYKFKKDIVHSALMNYKKELNIDLNSLKEAELDTQLLVTIRFGLVYRLFTQLAFNGCFTLKLKSYWQ